MDVIPESDLPGLNYLDPESELNGLNDLNVFGPESAQEYTLSQSEFRKLDSVNCLSLCTMCDFNMNFGCMR